MCLRRAGRASFLYGSRGRTRRPEGHRDGAEAEKIQKEHQGDAVVGGHILARRRVVVRGRDAEHEAQEINAQLGAEESIIDIVILISYQSQIKKLY